MTAIQARVEIEQAESATQNFLRQKQESDKVRDRPTPNYSRLQQVVRANSRMPPSSARSANAPTHTYFIYLENAVF
ncbi:hypothetical protein NUACC21_26430 [Scytonema sp. NUACC21]